MAELRSGVVLDGGVAIDGNRNQFLAGQQWFEKWTQAVLIETRQAGGQLRRLACKVVGAGEIKIAAGVPL